MSYQLRPYQDQSVEAVYEAWRENASTLLVLPTGTGKTVTFAAIVKRFLPARALILAHREELIFQAKEKLEALGISCDIEMADLTATSGLFGRSECVLASVQTMHRRLSKFEPHSFGLVVVDESHHSTAASYVKILEHFKQNPDLRILGVTATPDRADEEALGQIFDSVAYDYEILDAIHDGWLVPVDQQLVQMADLDFSGIRTTAGDLNGADLAAVMEQEKAVHGICSAAIEIVGDRQAIFFASSVVHAEKACEIFNRHRPNMATFVCGTTDQEVRRQRVDQFRTGKSQILTNVGVMTEGADFPNVSVIIGARPTKSRSLYAQMAGRGLRPLPGLVDLFSTADERKSAIAQSAKPACLLLDFCGNSGKHKLMTSVDILGGKVSDEVLERVETIMAKAKGQMRMVEVLAEAEAQLKREKEEREKAELARRQRVIAKVQYQTRTVNPFDVLDLTPVRERGWDKGKVLSEKQRALLLKSGVDGDALPYAQAKQILDDMFRRWNNELATFKQCALLKKHGVDATKFTRKEATAVINRIKENGWRAPRDLFRPDINDPDCPL